MGFSWLLLFSALCFSYEGVETMKQLVPQRIESVNGSAVNMGCTSSLVNIGGVMICTSQSYFVDGCSPAFDTNTSDWASQLVTVRKTHTDEIKYSHVLLTFVFDTAVTLTGVEMDLFLCPEWGIGAPTVSVCATKDVNFVFNETGHTVCLYRYPTDLPSIECVSLTHVIAIFETSNAYITWHIIFDPVKEWIHVGKVSYAEPTPTATASCKNSSITGHTESKVAGDKETAFIGTSGSAVLLVSAVSLLGIVTLLVIITLITVILTQCLLMLRMKRLRAAMQRDNIPLTFNEAYVPHNIMRPRDNGGFKY